MKHSPQDHIIYVLLTDTGTRFTKLIRLFTSAPYNHASIALDAELGEMYSFGRKRPTDPWNAGFIREKVNEETFRHFPQTRCALLRLHVTKRQRAAIVQTIRSFQQQREIYRYNLIGLLGVLIQREVAPKNAFFCSQFVAEVLRSAGQKLWTRPSGLVTPNDFLHHPAFELVYEGLLSDYAAPGRTPLPAFGAKLGAYAFTS